MFRIKICGITSEEDARLAVDAGADAVGLNFYQHSPRYLDVESAKAIAAAIPPGVIKVGVFVNAPVDEVAATALAVQLDAIQLHGDESPEFLASVSETFAQELIILRAYRCGAEGLEPLAEYLSRCAAIGRPPDAVLVDAAVPGQYGGSGQVTDWQRLVNQRTLLGDVPCVLAGGLTPENVAEAIQHVRPNAVDVASGVEASPGHKDPLLVRNFVASAAAAFSQS